MPSFDKIGFAQHARTRLSERNFTEADATSTICDPDKKTFQMDRPNGEKRYLHEKRIGETKLLVVADINGKEATIVTAFWQDGKEP